MVGELLVANTEIMRTLSDTTRVVWLDMNKLLSLKTRCMRLDTTKMNTGGHIVTVANWIPGVGQWGQQMADTIEITIGPPQTVEVKCFRAHSCSQWEPLVDKIPKVKALADAAAMQQMIATENEAILNQIYAFRDTGGYGETEVTDYGLVSLDTLIDLAKGAHQKKSRINTFVMHSNRALDLFKDPRLSSTESAFRLNQVVLNPDGTVMVTVPVLGYRIVSSPVFPSTDILVGYDYNYYMIQAYSMSTRSWYYNQAQGLSGVLEGLAIMAAYGFNILPDGGDFVSWVNVAS